MNRREFLGSGALGASLAVLGYHTASAQALKEFRIGYQKNGVRPRERGSAQFAAFEGQILHELFRSGAGVH
jgi:hypothetical protein